MDTRELHHAGGSPLFVDSIITQHNVTGAGLLFVMVTYESERVSRTNWTNDAMTTGFSGPLRFSLLSLFFVILSISVVLNIHKSKSLRNFPYQVLPF